MYCTLTRPYTQTHIKPVLYSADKYQKNSNRDIQLQV